MTACCAFGDVAGVLVANTEGGGRPANLKTSSARISSALVTARPQFPVAGRLARQNVISEIPTAFLSRHRDQIPRTLFCFKFCIDFNALRGKFVA